MWDIFWTFRRPQWFDARGIVPFFLCRYATGVTLRHIVRSCEIPRALNVEPLLRIDRSQLRWFGYVSRMPHKRLARQVLLAKPRESGPEVVQALVWVTTSPTLLGPVFLWSLQNYCMWNCCWPWGIPKRPSLEEKRAWIWMKWITVSLFALFIGV